MRPASPLVVTVLCVLASACRLREQGQSPMDAGQDVEAMPVDVDSAAGQGQLAVQARGCPQCHQSPDPTDGVLSGQTTPVPGTLSYGSNLTPDPDTGMDFWDAGSIAASVLGAVDVQGQPLCPTMPSYADAGMSTDEAFAIAAYLRSLTPVWHAVPASRCSAGDASP